jgi:hypothetical protein
MIISVLVECAIQQYVLHLLVKKLSHLTFEFHISFYAWRIYKCMNLPEYGLL